MPLPSPINNQGIVESTNSKNLSLELQTTMMLKLLTKLFPTKNFSADWLKQNVRNGENQTFKFKSGIIEYIGQPKGKGSEHFWRITLEVQWLEKLHNTYQSVLNDIDKGVLATVENRNGLTFLSKAEVLISEVLEAKKVLFFPNATARICNQSGGLETKIVDFLVFNKGKCRILEVDGKQHDKSRAEDYKRDRMFDREGLKTTRFTASECLNNPNAVVQEFLDLFECPAAVT
jgi:hypothetical protein